MVEIRMEKKVWEAGSSKAKDQGGQGDLFFLPPFKAAYIYLFSFLI